MGLSPNPSSMTPASKTHKAFLLCNYLLIAAACSCAFLTISLRLIPSSCGLLLVLLHALTIAASATSTTTTWRGSHTAAAALAAILQGSAAVLALSRTSDFLLSGLRSYVREEDGVVILKMAGGLGAAIFVLEWASIALASVEMMRSARVQQGEELRDWHCPFQV